MTEKTWGFRFNEHSDYQHFTKSQKPAGCPDWLESHQIHTWQKEGLVVWNSTDKKIEALNAGEALRLLSQLHPQDNWISAGISITRLVHEIAMPLPHRGGRKKTEQKPEIDTTNGKPIYKEILHLPVEAGLGLIELLQMNQHTLSEIAEQEKKRFDEAVRQLWKDVLKFSRRKEQGEFDFKARPFEWQCFDESRWICHHGSIEGRVCLEKNQLWWHACVKREGVVANSYYLADLRDAVERVEKELNELVIEPEEPILSHRIRTEAQRIEDCIRLAKKLADGPHWIDSARTEPSQITYRLFIELDAEPVSFKTYESICGDAWRYQEHYLSPSKLARVLNLDIDRFYIEQPAGENSEWYRMTSVTGHYDASFAAEEAQKAWGASQILQQFKAEKISRARYGYQEEETAYTVYLGGCENPNRPWKRPSPRNDHMQLRALQESLSFALDVNDYRDYLGLSTELISDERILLAMHRTRSRSKYLPDNIKRESKVWLAQHGVN